MSKRQCDDCGRFVGSHGASWASIYDMVGMQLSHEHIRCRACTSLYGPVQSNAQPADGNMRPYEGWVSEQSEEPDRDDDPLFHGYY